MKPAGAAIGLALPKHGALVVVDLEYTSWEGALARGWSGPDEHREIVQIGAVRLEVANGLAETAALSRLVLPRITRSLPGYFTALAGIDAAPPHHDGAPNTPALARRPALAPWRG